MSQKSKEPLGGSRAGWIRRRHSEGWTVAGLALEYDVSCQTIRSILNGRTYNRSDARRPERARAARERKAAALGAWAETGDADQLGATTSPRPILPALVAIAPPPPKTPELDTSPWRKHDLPAQGEKHGRHKLTDADVIEARRLRRLGRPIARLAERLGVAQNTLGYAASGRTWRHLPMVSIDLT
jgi:lambda repressor-like predicted transcriptional regulator